MDCQLDKWMKVSNMLKNTLEPNFKVNTNAIMWSNNYSNNWGKCEDIYSNILNYGLLKPTFLRENFRT